MPRKLRPGDKPPRLIPPVSSTIKTRKKKFHRGPRNRLDNGAGRLQRSQMRNLMRKRFALLTREDISRDSSAYEKFSDLVHDVTNDLGGPSRLSTIEKTLVEAFVSATVRMEDLTARQMLGDHTFYKELGNAISAMSRVAYLLGLNRRVKDITPTLSSYLKDGNVIDGETINE